MEISRSKDGVITEGILRTGCVVDGALYGVHGGIPEGAAGGKACVSYGALYGAVTEGALRTLCV